MPAGVDEIKMGHTMHTVYIALGSNLGPKLDNCRRAIESLGAHPAIRLQAVSRYYQTEPVDYLEQDWFVNAAAKLETTLDPIALLGCLKDIERKSGRTPTSIPFGPRVLDLDIILFDDLVLDSPKLILPHPRMHKRRFVLAPICDIGPDIVHPVLGKDIRSLLEGLDAAEQKVVVCDETEA